MTLSRTTGVSDAYIRRLEELTLDAWPSLETILYDGWVLRFAAGYTRRANAVHPLYPSHEDIPEKLRVCQRLYRDRGLPAVFKLTPSAQDLDTILAQMGYALEAPSSVLMRDLSDLPQPARENVELLPQANGGWLASYCMLDRDARRHFVTLGRMMERLAIPACFLSLREEGETVGLGLAVAEQDYVGLFNLVTRQSKRNQGIGRDVALHLLEWGVRQGAKHAYLQVADDNAPANQLYRSLGFQEVYRYHYRVRQHSR